MEHRMKEMAEEAERVLRKEKKEKEIWRWVSTTPQRLSWMIPPHWHTQMSNTHTLVVCCRARMEREREVRLKEKERLRNFVQTSESRRSSEDINSKAIAKGAGSRELLRITPSRHTRSTTLPSELRRRSTVRRTAQHCEHGRRATAPANIITSVQVYTLIVCSSE